MYLTFDTTIAAEVGADAAVVFNGIRNWVRHNELNGTNFNEGRYWTFNSRKALTDEYDYLSEDQVKRCLVKLEAADLIVKGNFNKITYDRTTWYTLTDKGQRIVQESEKRNRPIHCAETPNPLGEIAQSNGQDCPTNTNSLPKKEQSSIVKQHPLPHGYSGIVLLTPFQYDKLCDKYGSAVIEEYISKVEDWCVSKNYKYKNWSQALAKWIEKDIASGSLTIEEAVEQEEGPKGVTSY